MIGEGTNLLEIQRVFSDLNIYAPLSKEDREKFPTLYNHSLNLDPFKELLHSITTLSGTLNALYNGYRVLKHCPKEGDYEKDTPEDLMVPYIQDLNARFLEIQDKRKELTDRVCHRMKALLRIHRLPIEKSEALRNELIELSKVVNPNNLQKEIGLIRTYIFQYNDKSPQINRMLTEFENLNEDLISGLMPLRAKMLEDFGFKEAFKYLIDREYERFTFDTSTPA